MRTPERHRDLGVKATGGIEPSDDDTHRHDALQIRAIPLTYNASLESERYEIVTDGTLWCSFLPIGDGIRGRDSALWVSCGNLIRGTAENVLADPVATRG